MTAKGPGARVRGRPRVGAAGLGHGHRRRLPRGPAGVDGDPGQSGRGRQSDSHTRRDPPATPAARHRHRLARRWRPRRTGTPAEEEPQRHDQVREVGGHLQPGHPVVEVRHAADELGPPAAGRYLSADVEGQVVASRQHIRVLQVAHSVGEDARHDDDQHRSGDPEEPGEIDLQHTAVEADAQHDRDEQPDQRAEQRRRRRSRRLRVRPDEQRGLQAFAGHGDERGDDESRTAGQQGITHPGPQLACHAPSGSAHPEDHRRDEDDGHQAGDSAEDLLRPGAHLRTGEREHGPEREARHRRGGDAQPDRRQRSVGCQLADRSDQDRDDQPGLQALSKPHQ